MQILDGCDEAIELDNVFTLLGTIPTLGKRVFMIALALADPYRSESQSTPLCPWYRLTSTYYEHDSSLGIVLRPDIIAASLPIRRS